MRRWPFVAALRLVPATWRDTIRLDLEQDAQELGRGVLWCSGQALRVAFALRWSIGGSALFADLRYAVRSLLHARWFTIGAALTFAVGIGINLAVFSAVDRILFRPLPYSDSQRLVSLRRCNPKTGQCGGAFPDAIAKASPRLSSLGEFGIVSYTSYALAPESDAPPLSLYLSSANTLRVLGVHPVLGRDFSGDDVSAKRSAVLLSFETWTSRFGQDPATVGRRIGRTQSAEIIGILPPGFIPPSWMSTDPAWNGLVLSVDGPVMAPFARLKPGYTASAAEAEVNALAANLPDIPAPPSAPKAAAGVVAPVIFVRSLESTLFDRYADYAWLAAGASALVLLMACTNLAGLLLARGRSREHEAAIRTALGASAARVVFGAMIEAALVCVAGAGIAWVVLLAASRAIVAMLPALFGRYLEGPAEPRVVIAAVAASVVCGIIAGAWPGARMAYVDVGKVLQRGGRTGRQARLPGGRGLLIVESALGVLLVLGAMLAVRSFGTLANESLGYEPRDLYRLSASTPARLAPADSLAQYKQLLRIVRELPNVVAVAGCDAVMTNGATAMRGFSKDRTIRGGRYELSAGFFAAVGGSLAAGREFNDEEVDTLAPVALLNQAALTLVWPGISPAEAVGRVLALQDEPARTIIGIAPTVRRNFHGEPEEAAIYVPLGNEPASYGQAILRLTPGASPPIPEIRQRIGEQLGPRTVGVSSVQASLDPSLKDPRFRAVLLSALALCALLLAAAGLYAMASFEVSMRRYEMGVRMTLGASAAGIQRHVILDALRPSAIGVLIGVVTGLWASQLIEAFLYKTNQRDPWTLALVVLVLLSTAALAAWLPARRASRTDPAAVLRTQ